MTTTCAAIGAHLGWTVMVYNIAETLPNFINPL
jgi:short-chain fatty acids transporter